MNKLLMLKVLGLCLVSMFIGAIVVYGATPTVTQVLSGGDYPGSSDWTIWTDGTNSYAKTSNGVIEYSGTVDSDVIQDVIDASSSGATIIIKSGTYTIMDQINVTKWISIEGETIRGVQVVGSYGTILEAGDDMNALIYVKYYPSGFGTEPASLRYLTLDGQDPTYDVESGVRIHATHGVRVEECVIRDFTDYGVRLQSSEEIFIEKCTCISNGQFGIFVENAFASYIIQNEITYNVDDGIRIQGPTSILHIFQNDIYLNTEHGIRVYTSSGGDKGVVISENNIHDNTYYGIASTPYLWKARIYANRFVDNGYGATNGITNHNATEFWGNYGYITENSGNATISASTSVVVNHGLSIIPTNILVTLGNDGAGDVWVDTVTSTQFTVNVDNSDTYIVYWRAYYDPPVL